MPTIDQFFKLIETEGDKDPGGIHEVCSRLRSLNDPEATLLSEQISDLDGGMLRLDGALVIMMRDAMPDVQASFEEALKNYDITPLRDLFVRAADKLQDRFPLEKANAALAVMGLLKLG